MFGEHGDSSFVPWSIANISNVPIAACHDLITIPGITTPKLDPEDVEQYVRKSGGRVIARKGATFYAVAMSVCHICKCIFAGAGTALTVSTMMHGEYGVDDVCLSTLALVDRTGVRGKVLNRLTDHEIAQLRASADKLKEVIRQIEI